MGDRAVYAGNGTSRIQTTGDGQCNSASLHKPAHDSSKETAEFINGVVIAAPQIGRVTPIPVPLGADFLPSLTKNVVGRRTENTHILVKRTVLWKKTEPEKASQSLPVQFPFGSKGRYGLKTSAEGHGIPMSRMIGMQSSEPIRPHMPFSRCHVPCPQKEMSIELYSGALTTDNLQQSFLKLDRVLAVKLTQDTDVPAIPFNFRQRKTPPARTG